MPTSAPSPCTAQGCGELTTGGPCEQHRKQRQADYNQWRGSAASRGYDREWYRWLAAFKAGSDLDLNSDAGVEVLIKRNRCGPCWAEGKRTTEGLEYDHIIPLSRSGARLDAANVQPLCGQHHRAKTARERIWGVAIKPITAQVVIVWGPPCGGKSTWAEAEAKQSGGVVVDFDVIMARLSGAPLHVRRVRYAEESAAEYWREIERAKGTVYAISARPERVLDRVPQASLHLIDPGIATCLQRADSRPEAEETKEVILKWYDDYSGDARLTHTES
jgi:5-methylcytosine-specific restriction protein A